MKSFFTKGNALLLIVAVFSGANITNQFARLSPLSLLVSVIGVGGCVLYGLRNRLFKRAILVWILAQLFTLEKQVDIAGVGRYNEKIFDLTQAFSFKTGIYFHSGNVSRSINFNILCLLFFWLFRSLKVASLIGKQVCFNLRPGRQEVVDGPLMIAGVARQRASLDEDDSWILVALDEPLTVDGETVAYILAGTEDGLLDHRVRRVIPGVHPGRHVPVGDTRDAPWIEVA